MSTPSASYTSYFTSTLSVGLGVTIPNTPVTSVMVDASVNLEVYEGGSSSFYVYIYSSTTSIPMQGSAPGGSDTTLMKCYDTGVTYPTKLSYTCSFNFVNSGLTVGTTYYYHIAVGGGILSIRQRYSVARPETHQ